MTTRRTPLCRFAEGLGCDVPQVIAVVTDSIASGVGRQGIPQVHAAALGTGRHLRGSRIHSVQQCMRFRAAELVAFAHTFHQSADVTPALNCTSSTNPAIVAVTRTPKDRVGASNSPDRTGASMSSSRKPVVLWRESEWRCEYHHGFGGSARLEVYHGDRLATAEDTPSGDAARIRAEVLRRRALRGNIASS